MKNLKTQEQPKVEAQKQTQEQPKALEKEKQPRKEKVNQLKYDQYTNLKFLALSGAKLTVEKQKELATLESELKSCSGKVATITVRAAIANEICLMVENIPVPESIEKIVKAAKQEEYYFA